MKVSRLQRRGSDLWQKDFSLCYWNVDLAPDCLILLDKIKAGDVVSYFIIRGGLSKMPSRPAPQLDEDCLLFILQGKMNSHHIKYIANKKYGISFYDDNQVIVEEISLDNLYLYFSCRGTITDDTIKWHSYFDAPFEIEKYCLRLAKLRAFE
jgi:hypothetical protein